MVSRCHCGCRSTERLMEKKAMAKYAHRMFEMYDLRDEAARALTPRVERPTGDITSPLCWAVKYLTVCRIAGITHIRFQGTQDFGDETLNDLRQDFARVADVLDRDSKVVLDFSDVVSFDAGAINAVALFHRKLQTKGSRIALWLAPAVRTSFFLRKDTFGADEDPVFQAGRSEQNARDATGDIAEKSRKQDRVDRGHCADERHENRGSSSTTGKK